MQMAVIIKNMEMPPACEACWFGKRIDNMHTMCELHPNEQAIEDGESKPDYCELEEPGEQ